jgi:hypothetical protein
VEHERVTAAPLWELGFLTAIGPCVEESGIGLIAYHPYSAPYEDLNSGSRGRRHIGYVFSELIRRRAPGRRRRTD